MQKLTGGSLMNHKNALLQWSVFIDRMMKLHGDRANPGSLWDGVTAAKAHHSSKTASV
jgi:hypothetical protein